jgi:hypothetical protein
MILSQVLNIFWISRAIRQSELMVRDLGEEKRARLVAILSNVLLISPFHINAANPSFLNRLFNISTVTGTITKKSVEILGEAKNIEENVKITSWPNRTKLLCFSSYKRKRGEANE